MSVPQAADLGAGRVWQAWGIGAASLGSRDKAARVLVPWVCAPFLALALAWVGALGRQGVWGETLVGDFLHGMHAGIAVSKLDHAPCLAGDMPDFARPHLHGWSSAAGRIH